MSWTHQGSACGSQHRYCCRQHCERDLAAPSRCAPVDVSTTLRGGTLVTNAKNSTIIKVSRTKPRSALNAEDSRRWYCGRCSRNRRGSRDDAGEMVEGIGGISLLS